MTLEKYINVKIWLRFGNICTLAYGVKPLSLYGVTRYLLVPNGAYF